MRDRFIFIIIISFLSTRIFSQEVAVPDVISAVAEELAADESDPEAAEIYVDLLNDLAEDPVHVNSTDNSELSRLFFLTDFQIRSLADYTRSTGKIVSPYEIANIPGFDRETASMMLPFITLSGLRVSSPDSARFRSTLLTNLSLRSSDIDSSANGPPFKHLVKYRFTSGNITGGFTTEKDPGEKYFDFLSAHMAYSGNRLIRKVIIGDFGARFGLGTNINTGMRTGLSLTTPVNISLRNEIRPYTSTDENNFFRGLAACFQLNDFQLMVYHSLNKIDATLLSGTRNEIFIESLYKTGLHQSLTSLVKKDAVNETSSGVNLTYRFKNLNAGLSYTRHTLSLPVQVPGNSPLEIYDFTGKMNQVISVSYTGLIGRLILSGEFSANDSLKTALVQSLSMRPADRLTVNLLFRRYEPGYKAFHSNGPLSSSSGDNLTGLFGSFSLEAAKFLFISAGCDISYYPWMKYRCTAPSLGTKGEVRVKYIPSERFLAEFVYNKRFSVSDSKESTGISKQDEITGRSVRCLLKYSAPSGLCLTSRVDLKVITPSEVKGMLLMQDFNYKFRKVPVSIWFRHCIFNTGDWNARIYVWENDLLYNFSIPAFSGKGSRTYMVAGWKFRDHSEFRIKYGITSEYEGQDTRELRLQLRVGF